MYLWYGTRLSLSGTDFLQQEIVRLCRNFSYVHIIIIRESVNSREDIGIETTSVITTTDSATESVAKDCVFPFTYAGVQYAQCTDVDSVTGRPWCATASEYSSSEWRFCSE